MSDVETRLHKVLGDIAKEHGYSDHKVDLKPISSGGANYTSQLYAITLSSPQKDDLKLFSKVAALGKTLRSISDVQLFEIEIIFYTKIFLRFKDLEEKYNIPEEERLILPKYYGGISDYSQELMILEDVTAKKFQSFDRFKYFDWKYASTCVGTLAKFQALSMAFEKEHPEEYAGIINTLKHKAASESMFDFFDKFIAIAVEATDEIFRDKVKLFLQNEMRKQTFLKFFNPDRKVLLTHGDFRPSNILYKEEDGKLQVVVVDYQMIKQGNPVTDLVYFLISGSDEEFRSKHLHQFFNHYYDTLSQSLHRLGIEPDEVYTEKDFREDVKKMLPFGLMLATFTLLFVTVEEDNAPKPSDVLELSTVDIKASDQFHVRFNGLVRDYVAMGIL